VNPGRLVQAVMHARNTSLTSCDLDI